MAPEGGVGRTFVPIGSRLASSWNGVMPPSSRAAHRAGLSARAREVTTHVGGRGLVRMVGEDMVMACRPIRRVAVLGWADLRGIARLTSWLATLEGSESGSGRGGIQ